MQACAAITSSLLKGMRLHGSLESLSACLQPPEPTVEDGSRPMRLISRLLEVPKSDKRVVFEAASKMLKRALNS